MTALTPARGVIEFRLSLLYAATFMISGIQIPFLPVWLGSRGLDDWHIAFVLGLPQLLRIVSTPAVSRWADRSGDFVGVLAASLIVMTSMAATLIVATRFAPILAAVALYSCAQGVAIPLTDALTFAALRRQEEKAALAGAPQHASSRQLEYGRMRKWGSIAFIVGNLVGGAFLTLTSVSIIPFGITGFALLSVGAALYAAPVGASARAPASSEPQGPNTRRLGLLIPIFLAAAFIQSSHALLNTFGSLHWAREGFSSAFTGSAWALGVLCETAFFAFVGRWVGGADGAAALLALGGLTAMLRWLVMASDPGAALLMLAQAGHGFSFAATHTGAMYLLLERAPHAMRARAQGWLTATIAGFSALVVTLSGPLYAWLGEIAYLGMAGLAGIGVALAIVVAIQRRPAR